jgi:LynF/TruF/PatF family peptide O-prenyltransferase
MVTSAIQTTSLSDQRLRFIKAHRQAFEVEPSLYPLEIFEDFIAKLDDNSVSSLEASAKSKLINYWQRDFSLLSTHHFRAASRRRSSFIAK